MKKHLFNNNSTEYSRLKDIPDNILNDAITLFNYQQNWKPETRIKVIKEKGEWAIAYIPKTLFFNKAYYSIHENGEQ